MKFMRYAGKSTQRKVHFTSTQQLYLWPVQTVFVTVLSNFPRLTCWDVGLLGHLVLLLLEPVVGLPLLHLGHDVGVLCRCGALGWSGGRRDAANDTDADIWRRPRQLHRRGEGRQGRGEGDQGNVRQHTRQDDCRKFLEMRQECHFHFRAKRGRLEIPY